MCSRDTVLYSIANVRLIFFDAVRGPESQMAQRSEILQTLEVMRENLRETLKETSALRQVSIEEEVIDGMENIDKTCSNALRYLRQIETLLRYDRPVRNITPGRK